MNVYDLSRIFWDYAFENPDKIKPNHIAMYFFAIEHCNRLGWKEKFGFPTTMVMDAISIKSYNTYIKTLSDLVETGFIKMIEKSKNQYSANIIALSKFDKANDKANDKALDKALIKHTTKQVESTIQSTVQSIDSINKQIYNTTNIPIYNITDIAENEFSTSTQKFEEEKNEGDKILDAEKNTSKKVAKKKVSKKYFNKEDFKNRLLELEVLEKDADDWIEVRRQKRAVFTENAIREVINECEKHSFSFPEAIKASGKYGWQGFKYEWYLNKVNEHGITNNNSNSNTNGSGNSGRANSNAQKGTISFRNYIAKSVNEANQTDSGSEAFTLDAEIVQD